MNAKDTHRLRRFILLLSTLVFSGCTSAGYIRRAYFFPGSTNAIRGYPIIEPPRGYTGTWTHYTYTGRTLAILQYRDGHEEGRQVYLDDSGQPYLIRYSRNGSVQHVELKRPIRQWATVPWLFPQRWLHPAYYRELSQTGQVYLQPLTIPK